MSLILSLSLSVCVCLQLSGVNGDSGKVKSIK